MPGGVAKSGLPRREVHSGVVGCCQRLAAVAAVPGCLGCEQDGGARQMRERPMARREVVMIGGIVGEKRRGVKVAMQERLGRERSND
ncbi:MAG: hypothetical protein DCC66_04055 [Planctomycetota bacterium]|nr:MAG: hypothetical protein DCC66_04055 [Planctomycetota bacterium]